MRTRFAISALLTMSFTVAVLLPAGVGQDKPKTKPPIEEEEDPKAPKKPMPGTKPPVSEEEDPGAAKGEFAWKPGSPVNLAEEAKKNWGHPEIPKHFGEFAIPHDVVISGNQKEYKVKPLPKKLDPFAPGTLTSQTVETLKPDGSVAEKFNLAAIQEVRQYEQQILRRVGNWVENGLGAPGVGMPAPPRHRVLLAGEMLLTEGLRFHQQAKTDKVRAGNEWAATEQKLQADIRGIQLARVRALAEAKAWASAEALAKYLYEQDRHAQPVREAVEHVWVARAQTYWEAGKFGDVRKHLENLPRVYPLVPGKATEAMQDRLRERSSDLIKKGMDAVAQGKNSQARQFLYEAEMSWPGLPQVRDLRKKLAEYPVLLVGVRQLPTNLHPTTAQLDVDRIASRLVFEPLVKLRDGPSARDGYVYRLGVEAPVVGPGGWEFAVPRDLAWSDGKPVTAADITRSLQLVSHPDSSSYDPAAAELLKPLPFDDPQRLTIALTRSHFDPCAMMTFDVVSAAQFPENGSPRTPASRTPIGTGPYMFDRADSEVAVFLVNPHFRRAHAPNGPIIKEVHFVKYDDFNEAKDMLAAGKLHMLLDLHTNEKEALESAGKEHYEVFTPTEQPTDLKSASLANPRVYFLAPNFRRAALKNDSLRKAIALAIDRERVLDDVFRGKGAKFHHALNGPFPIGSWAWNPKVDNRDPFNLRLAQDQLARARKELGTIDPLTLTYAADDAAADLACKSIRSLLDAEGIKLKITLKPMPRDQLLAELHKERPEFDLLYTHLDFTTEALAIWPLFDSKGLNGKGQNFIGYPPDGKLHQYLQEIQTSRDVQEVRRATHNLHEMMMLEEMPLIPLWQIDRHVAIHRSVRFPRPPGLHPLWVFDDLEAWRFVEEAK